MKTKLLLASAAVTAAAAATPALAADGADKNWTVTVGAATDYRSKGTSKTMGEPYAYASVEWRTDDELFYVAAGTAKVDQSFGAEIETEVRVGARPEIAGFEVGLEAMYRYYPDADDGTDDDYWEFTADVSRTVGPVGGRLRVQYSPDNAGGSHAFTYYEARGSYKVTPKLRASAAVGRRETEDSIDYTAWNAGITFKATDNLDLDLRWYDTNRNSYGENYEEALVAGVTFKF